MFQPRAAAALVATAALRVSARRDQTRLHRTADQHLSPLTTAIFYAFAQGRKVLRADLRDVDGAVLATRTALLKLLPDLFARIFVAGAGVATKPFRTAAQFRTLRPGDRSPLRMAFDVSDPRAVKWATDHAAELARDLTQTMAERIRQAIADAVDEGTLDDSYDAILASVGDADRAQLIARTEVMTAAHEGQRAGWGAAVESGLLSADATVAWMTAGDPCPECEALDGVTRPLDGTYPSPGGDGPPLHPNCRCTEGIV